MAKKNTAGKGPVKPRKSKGTPSAAAENTSPVISDAVALEIQSLVSDQEVVLTDAEGRRFCRAADCDQLAQVDAYCRYHYLLLWKKIQNRKKIIADGKLMNYIEELTARYSDKFIELLRKDLRTEKDFISALHELNLDVDEASSDDDDDDEDDKSYLEEIRGVSASDDSKGDDY